MLKFIRSGQRWLTGLFVLGIGGVFVFFIGLGGPLTGPSAGSVVEVGPYRFGIRDFERARTQRENQYREALGQQFNPEIFSSQLDRAASDSLVDRGVLALAAQDLGLRVAKSEVEQAVAQIPIFRDESGRFDPERFQNWAEYEYGNQRNFLRSERISILAHKMLRVLQTQAEITEDEAREAVRQKLQAVRIGFVVLDTSRPPEGVEVSEEARQAALAGRDDELRNLYDQQDERFNVPEQVRARHILLRVESDAEEDVVEEQHRKAEDLLQQLRDGSDFAVLASEWSDDPGSKDSGGDLGFFRRGQMVPPFEEVAFALEPGALSEEPVRSDFGFHLIRVEEHQQAQTRAFEEVRDELATELVEREHASRIARELAERLSAGVREGRSLENTARAEGLTVERSGELTRRADGFVPKLGASQELMATAFTLEAGQSSPRVFQVDDRLALVQTFEHIEPAADDVEFGLEEERRRMLQRLRNAQIQAWLGARRASLVADGELYVNLAAIGR
jgi:peptidyl-prolyl cis-trans isomerase D